MICDYANGKNLFERRSENDFASICIFGFAVFLKQGLGSSERLIIGGLDCLSEVVPYLKIVALARLQRQSLRFCLEDNCTIAKDDKGVYLADLVSFTPLNMDICIDM